MKPKAKTQIEPKTEPTPTKEEQYATKYKTMMDPIIEHLDKNKIKLAAVIIIDAETNEPMPMIRGNLYEAAKLLKFSLHQLKRRINEELGDE